MGRLKGVVFAGLNYSSFIDPRQKSMQYILVAPWSCAVISTCNNLSVENSFPEIFSYWGSKTPFYLDVHLVKAVLMLMFRRLKLLRSKVVRDFSLYINSHSPSWLYKKTELKCQIYNVATSHFIMSPVMAGGKSFLHTWTVHCEANFTQHDHGLNEWEVY